MARRRTKKAAKADRENRKERPSAVFLPDFPDQVKAIAMRGLTDDEMAAVFGISKQLMQDWKKYYPDFKAAIEEGRTHADARVVQALFERSIGYTHPETKFAIYEGEFTDERTVLKHYPPDVAAIRMWLTNRQREHWKDRQSHEHGGAPDLPDIGIAQKNETKQELINSILGLIQPQPDGD